MKVLMVCLGNICRSPLAEGILQHKANKHGLNWQIESAGTGAWHVGHPPDIRAIKTAKKFGVNIANQKARKIAISDFDLYDLIFTMDTEVHEEVLRLAKTAEQRRKIYLFLPYGGNTLLNSVPDPYYGENADFEEAYHFLDNACDTILEKMLESK